MFGNNSSNLAVIKATGTGNVSITGTGGGSPSHGVGVGGSTTIESDSGSISVTGNGTNVDFTQTGGTNQIKSTSGDISVTANTISWVDLNFESAGSLVVQPRTAGTTIGLGGGAGTLFLDDTRLGFFKDGFSAITIGKSDAGNITVDTATFTDPLTLLTNGNITDAGASGTDVTAPSVTFAGTLAPDASPGTFSVNGNLVFADNSSFAVELTGTPTGGSHDRLDVSGNVTIGSNVTLNLNTTGFTEAGGTLTLINNGGGAVSGTFSGLSEGAQTNSGNTPNFIISYMGGDGNDVILTATDPTAADIADFRGAVTGDGIGLAWETLNESGLSGFHIWRGSAEAAETRLTASLIGAAGGLAGHEYTWQDAVPFTWGQRTHYWLEAVHGDGSSSFTGPVEVVGIGRLFLPSVGR